MTPPHTTGSVARVLLRRSVPWLAGVCGATAVVYAAIGAGVAIWATPGDSVWASASWVLHWAAFAGGVAVGGCLPVLVAHGVTRRRVTGAGTGVVLALALGLAVAVQLGLWVERAVHRATGTPHTVDGSRLYRTVDQVHLVLAEYTLMFAAFLVAGWLILTTYQRLGAWRGTLVIPLSLLPAPAALAALSAGWVGPDESSPPWAGTVERPLAAALALAAVAAGLLAVRGLTRTIPVSRS